MFQSFSKRERGGGRGSKRTTEGPFHPEKVVEHLWVPTVHSSEGGGVWSRGDVTTSDNKTQADPERSECDTYRTEVGDKERPDPVTYPEDTGGPTDGQGHMHRPDVVRGQKESRTAPQPHRGRRDPGTDRGIWGGPERRFQGGGSVDRVDRKGVTPTPRGVGCSTGSGCPGNVEVET